MIMRARLYCALGMALRFSRLMIRITDQARVMVMNERRPLDLWFYSPHIEDAHLKATHLWSIHFILIKFVVRTSIIFLFFLNITIFTSNVLFYKKLEVKSLHS